MLKQIVLCTLFLLPHAASADTIQLGPFQRLASAAQSQVGVTLIYDPNYVGLDFPGGDIPRNRGVCSDVVVRALRDAWDMDLQRIINADMRANFAVYPKIWGLNSTDRNIDHRRVPNMETLFRRAGASLPVSADANAYQIADIVSFRLRGSGLAHIGIISDQTSPRGVPLVTHNIGGGTVTENMLFDHDIVGHFRLTDKARAWLASR